MGKHHGRSYRRRARVLVVLGGLLGLGLSAQASVTTATITGFVPNPPGSGIAGNFVRGIDLWVAQNGITRITPRAAMVVAGRAVTTDAIITAAPTAGRVIAAACWANPLVCAGVGMAAWFAVNHLVLGSDGTWQAEETSIQPGYYRDHPYGGPTITGLTKEEVAQKYYEAICAGSFGNGSNGMTCVRWYPFQPTQSPWNNPTSGGQFVIIRKNSSGSETGGTYSLYYSANTSVTELVPATEGQVTNHGETTPVTPEAANESPVPVPVLPPDFVPGVVTIGDKYPGDDTPNEGPWKQDRVKYEGEPGTEDPTDIRTTPETVPVDNPNTPEIEGQDPTDPNADPSEKPVDPCELHPNSVMCTDLGTAPGDEVPKETSNIAWEWSPLGLPSACPAPIPTPHGDLSFQPVCDAAVLMSPLVQALGAFGALMICIAAIRRS